MECAYLVKDLHQIAGCIPQKSKPKFWHAWDKDGNLNSVTQGCMTIHALNFSDFSFLLWERANHSYFSQL